MSTVQATTPTVVTGRARSILQNDKYLYVYESPPRIPLITGAQVPRQKRARSQAAANRIRRRI